LKSEVVQRGWHIQRDWQSPTSLCNQNFLEGVSSCQPYLEFIIVLKGLVVATPLWNQIFLKGLAVTKLILSS
jgi:hypothetical protein